MSAGALVAALVATQILAPASPSFSEAKSEAACSVGSWQMTWGFKESFRAYLSGAIAEGEWQTGGDISYATPNFIIAGSRGTVAADASSGQLSAEGSIRFLGHSGLLDQLLSHPVLLWEGNSGVISLDVEGATQEGVEVATPQVEFVDLEWDSFEVNAATGVITASASEVSLRQEGAEAFGTYPEGEPFDPLEISIEVEPGCLEEVQTVPTWLIWLVAGLGAVGLGAIPLVRKWRGQARPTPAES